MRQKKWTNCAAIMDYIISIITAAGKVAVQTQMNCTSENQNTTVGLCTHALCSVIISSETKPR